MRFFRGLPFGVVLWAALAPTPVAAIESQAVALVEQVPASVRQVMRCGEWGDAQESGYYRLVLVDVSEGAGTEVYIQRMREAQDMRYAPQLLETIPMRQLNNDHAQYQVHSARCVNKGRKNFVELMATFEHDEGDWRHRIHIALDAPHLYAVSDTVLKRTPSKIAK